MVKKSEMGEKRAKPVNRGAWTGEEDRKLVDYVRTHGDKQWRTLPAKAGLNRCGKSCRLRWLNYLRPGIKRGNISEDEEDLILRLHNLLGNRWSLIAGRLPGRTDNEIKNHWNTHLSKRPLTMDDLNSKLSQTPESDSPPASQTTSPAAATALPPAEPSDAYQPPSEACLPALGVDHGMFPPFPEFDPPTAAAAAAGEKLGEEEDYSVVWPDACHSPSSIWFQPFAAEAFGFDELAAAFLDYGGLLPHFI